ncbi:MAG TPA: dehydrogenase E1 component subunit alpha/beta [Terriglobia bacterium]|nr:dehydrogenase E1 component subunit alpha/beta [Terriglobia bacterium]
MATKADAKPPVEAAEPKKAKSYEGLSPEQLVQMYRLMFLSRRLDDREILLKRQQKIFFQISGAGHEALLVAAGMALKPGYDWFYPYYRDRGLCLALGMTPTEMLLEAVGAADDPNSGGRQMPSHWGSKALHIVSQSSPTGTQILQAAGAAEASQYYARVAEAAELAHSFHKDELVYVSLGDGASSEGEFWESLNWVCIRQLPLLYVVEDNGYAISVSVDQQTAGGNLSALVKNFPGLLAIECDGTEFLESYDAMARAADYVRRREGPALVHAHVIRPYSHSLSDDERLYKPEEIRRQEAKRDPLTRLSKYLLTERVATEQELKQIEAGVDKEVREAADQALETEPPRPESVMLYVTSPTVDATSGQFDSPPKSQGDPKTMVDLINACLRDEMTRDPRVVVFGEDVADCTHDADLAKVKGKGGVFKVTHGLQRQFSSARCYNSHLAEASIVGRAIGMATRGLKPVVEIQFFDYIWPAMMQIRDEMTTLRWRSNNDFACPLVIRTAIGGYLAGGAIYHSQSGESIFTHLPGLHVVMPSTALDANGLLRTAIRCDDPVLFLEPKHLYRQTHNRGAYPGPDYMIPFGKAKLVREGVDLTIVTYGSLVFRAAQAAKDLEREGLRAEILDLRSLQPYDWELISASVKKTSRVLVLHEDSLSFGYGAEIAARIADELFEWLDAPVRRLAAKDTYVPYHPLLEDAVLPQPADIARACRELAAY